MYHLRIRFVLPEGEFLGYPESEIKLPQQESHYSLRAVDQGKVINESKQLVLHGVGFDTEEQAKACGQRAKNALMWCSATLRVGLDLGKDRATGGVTNHIKSKVMQNYNIRLRNHIHGLDVFDDAVPTEFVPASVSVSVSAVRNAEKFTAAFNQGYEADLHLTDKEIISFELYSASHFELSSRARFILLVIAVECLKEQKERCQEALDHVEKLIELTEQSGLEKSEIKSMLGSLDWLKKESISQAGNGLVEAHLGTQQYGGKTAKKFFQECYEARSKLVHNGYFPERTANGSDLVGELDRLVANLLVSCAGQRAAQQRTAKDTNVAADCRP